jgi:hypothetical protein
LPDFEFIAMRLKLLPAGGFDRFGNNDAPVVLKLLALPQPAFTTARSLLKKAALIGEL